MNSAIIFIGSFVGFVVWAFVLINIIQQASKSKQIERQLRIQTGLLAKIAEKQGVTREELTKSLSTP